MTKKKIWITLGILVAVLLLAWRWMGRTPSEADDANHSESGVSVPPAAVVRVERRPLGNTLTIAGEFKPFQDVEVHAKVAGYIRNINVDVGDHVKEGQVIAVLEVPELAAELSGADAAVRRSQEEIRRAQSDVNRAQSAHAAAHSGYARLKLASDARAGLVAQQEIDDSQAKDLEAEAQVSSAEAQLSAARQQLEVAQANQKQYNALANYSRITAPFAGVITARLADTGALIQGGTSASSGVGPVVRLAEVSKLRLVLPVPESVVAQIHLGDPVKAHIDALNQDFEGKVSRFSDSLDRQTRTMETEIDFPNKDGRLIPGMYAEAILSLAKNANELCIPLEAVARNNNEATVLVVNKNNEIEERKIKLGFEGESYVQVLGGVAEGDRVVIGGRSQFHPGQKVQPKDVSDKRTETAA
ncbi:MAG TPA: efflux RND transporter periplasmic adaptor subunit [Candidatus Acidoferrum sp.]|jgi:RND family efflux transporter MFP subunit|nr:efflux RND transporter periplasmic adaptor subunit [Candidatus Acidoferrum sp.]